MQAHGYELPWWLAVILRAIEFVTRPFRRKDGALFRILVLAVALLVSAPALAADLVGKVDRVIDGDTIVVAGVHVRLWGINAQERYTEPGKVATAFLRSLIDGKMVFCHDTGTKTWGRPVMQCFVLGPDLGDALVDSGNAVDWPKYSRGYYAR